KPEGGKTHMRQSASSACFWSGPTFAEGIMASGHAYRANGSNAWPLRLGSAEHQIHPYQRGGAHTWRAVEPRTIRRQLRRHGIEAWHTLPPISNGLIRRMQV